MMTILNYNEWNGYNTLTSILNFLAIIIKLWIWWVFKTCPILIYVEVYVEIVNSKLKKIFALLEYTDKKWDSLSSYIITI